jgi:hypothetical protein
MHSACPIGGAHVDRPQKRLRRDQGGTRSLVGRLSLGASGNSPGRRLTRFRLGKVVRFFRFPALANEGTNRLLGDTRNRNVVAGYYRMDSMALDFVIG